MTWRKLPTLALTLLIPVVSACGSRVSEEAPVRQAVPVRTATAPAPSQAAASARPASETSEPLVIFLGDSLTAGLGLAEDQAYPALLDRKLDKAGAPVRVLNAGVSGDTTAGGLSRLDWLLSQKPDVVVVGLGANDGLRALPLEETEKNLREIVRRAQAAGARVLLLGMQIPPNYGPDYTQAFADIYPRIAKDLEVPLVPFLLEKVGGIRELNLSDGIHPNAKGQEIVAENVLPYLEALVEMPAAVAVGP